ncbi:MAG: hypothetical protein RL277_265 [Planctomycetota bacterium]|jgi:hypothetical protein
MIATDSNRAPRAFLALLHPGRVQELHERRDCACGLWPDLTIAYVNPAWERFSKDNGANPGFSMHWREGSSFLDGVGRPLREYYRTHLLDALHKSQPWRSEYECSSPTLFRLYQMEAETVGNREGLLITHTRLEQRPHDKTTVRAPVDATPWKDPHGLIQQCSHCRRVRRAGEAEEWDWVPQWIERVPETATGSLCPPCIATRYPDLVRGNTG